MAVGDIFKVIVEQSLHAQRILNTFHYRMEIDAGGNAAFNLAQQFAAQTIPTWKAKVSNELSFVAVYAQKIWPLPPLVPEIDTTQAGLGGVAASSLPTSMAVVISKRTAFAGKKFRGRVFVCGIPVADELDSVLGPVPLANWQTVANSMNQLVIPAGYRFQPIIYHKVDHTFTNQTNMAAQRILRNQRRRQVGRGE